MLKRSLVAILLVAVATWLWWKSVDQRNLESAGASQQGRASLSSAEVPTTPGRQEAVTAELPQSLGSKDVPTPSEILEKSKTFLAAIAEARLRYGGSDQRVVDLQMMAESLCQGELDPMNALSRTHPDPSRAWAVGRVVELCEGFESMPPLGNSAERVDEGSKLVELMRRSDKAATGEAAKRLIRSADSYSDLAVAGQVMMESGTMPLGEILPGRETTYGPADLAQAWVTASQLSLCAGRGGCGPNSLATVSFCAAAGCRQGITFEQALTENLSPAQYRAVMAFQSWILRERSRVH